MKCQKGRPTFQIKAWRFLQGVKHEWKLTVLFVSFASANVVNVRDGWWYEAERDHGSRSSNSAWYDPYCFFAVHTKYPLTCTGHGPVLDISSVGFSCFRYWDDSGHPTLHWTCQTPLMWSFCCLYKIPTDLHRSWTRTWHFVGVFTLFPILGWLWISHTPLGLSMVTSLSLPSCSLYKAPEQDTR